MTTYQYAPAAPSRQHGSLDVTGWALIAVVVALLCAGIGWFVARQDAPSRDDVARTADLAGRTALVNGERAGYADGARLGRREASVRTKVEIARARQEGAAAGRDEGYEAGRSAAGDPNAYASAGLGASGAYPELGYEDVLRSGLFDGGDEPGFSSSAYSEYGYGDGAGSPYRSSSSSMSGLYGDDLRY